MGQKHKWHDEICAWAAGQEIEYRNNDRKMCWTKCETPMFDTDGGWEYRIKPQPKEPQYLYVYADEGGINFSQWHTEFVNSVPYIGKIKLEQDE